MRLFINYSYLDKTEVEQVVNLLLKNGHEPWFEKLLPNQEWKTDLLAAIKSSNAMIYALSPDSVMTEWCQWAFAQAVIQGKPIIPLIVRSPVNIPPTIRGLRKVDISEGIPEAVAERLLDSIIHFENFHLPPDVTLLDSSDNPHGIPSQAMGTIVPPGMRAPDHKPTEE